MNEERAVLDFFAKEENLPLGLSVAEQMDTMRKQMNNRFWQQLQQRLAASIEAQGLAWQVEPTEDRNAPDCLVGVHCSPSADQEIYLRVMAEQQYLGREWHIYFGLMWSSTPSPEHLGLSAVSSLKQTLLNAGFSNNANFLAWQWTAFHPCRRDFLLRYAREPEILLDEMGALLKKLLIDHGDSILQANTALRSAPRSMTISLERLHSKRSDY
ncbi:MAG: hypothetical protein ACOY9D_06920 [Pseudomonadota bacterium]